MFEIVSTWSKDQLVHSLTSGHVSTSKCPKHFGGAFVKVGDLLSFVTGRHWPELPNLAAKYFHWPLEFDPDPLGLIGEACIPPPRFELQDTS